MCLVFIILYESSSKSRLIHLSLVHGGTGGDGGTGGVHGGHGGIGEGAKFDIRDSYVLLTEPHATSMLFYGLQKKLKLMNHFKEIRFINEKLAKHIATKHEYTDQSKRLCAPGTRVQIQADILKWLSPQPGTNARIFWITGIAGSGKSTLSATVVENLREMHTPVAAQFFISRNIPETVDQSKIIPTIAKQLAEFSPAAAGIIHGVLKRGFPPGEKQVEELLLAPIRKLPKSHKPVVIVIDALDELQNAAESVLEVLSQIASKGHNLPDNVRFLITSRPEHWADISKSKTLELTVFKQHGLETDSSVNEVHHFIVARMKEITPWNDWPSDSEMQKLSDQANGLFHYAATALHWIKEQIRKRGTASRKHVFENFAQMGIGQLENLYRLILTSFEDIDQPAEDDQRGVRLASFQHIIGTILVLYEPLTIGQIIALLGDFQEDEFDVEHFLLQFHSVLIPGTTRSFEEATPQMHKSFRDYIMDVHAPAEFRILTGHAHFVTARRCLEVIVKGGSQFNGVLEYSVKHWDEHLQRAVEGQVTWEDGRMSNLVDQMGIDAVVDVWKQRSRIIFVNVATVGWDLLKVRANCGRDSQMNNDLPAGQ
jgi:nucleoside-triphosphatase THEP1